MRAAQAALVALVVLIALTGCGAPAPAPEAPPAPVAPVAQVGDPPAKPPVVEPPIVKPPVLPKPPIGVGEAVPTGHGWTVGWGAGQQFRGTGRLTAESLREEGTPIALYLVPLRQGESCEVRLESADFAPAIRLLNPYGQYLTGTIATKDTRTASLLVEAPYTGLYRLYVSAAKDGTGAFTLSLRATREEPRPLELAELEVKTGVAFRPKAQEFAGGVTAQTFLFAKARAIADALWSEDGRWLYVLERGGLLRRIDVATWTETHRRDLGHRCNNLALSRVGLLVSVLDQVGNVAILDPETLAERRKLAGPSLVRVASAPGLHVAVVAGHVQAYRARAEDAPADGNGSLYLIDLRGGRFPKTYHNRPARNLAVTPDGRAVLVQNASRGVTRYTLNEMELRDEQATPGFAPEGQKLGVSTDGGLFWLTSPEGNRLPSSEARTALGEPPYAVFFYPVEGGRAWREPDFLTSIGPGTRVAAYDPRVDLVYTHTAARQLVALTSTGAYRCALTLTAAAGGNETLGIHPHPDGRRVLVRFANRLALVDLAALHTKDPDALRDAERARRVLFSKLGKFEETTFLSPRDRLGDSEAVGKRYLVHLEKGRIFRALVESHKRLHCRLRLYSPGGRLLEEGQGDRLFIGHSATVDLRAKESGIYRLDVTSVSGKDAGEYHLRLSCEKGPVNVAELLPPVPPSEPIVVNAPLKTQTLPAPPGAKVTTIALPVRDDVRYHPGKVCWSADGKAVYLVDDFGAVLRVSAAGVLERRLPLEKQKLIGGLGMSARGIVVWRPRIDVWLLDPATLSVRARHEAPGLEALCCAPGSPLAVLQVTAGTPDARLHYGNGQKIQILDLERGVYLPRPEERYEPQGYRLTMTPDGRQLFGLAVRSSDAVAALEHLAIEKGQLIAKGSTRVPVHNGIQVVVSPDNRFVAAAPDGTGSISPTLRPGPYRTPVLFVEPKSPLHVAAELPLANRPRALALDPKGRFILASGEGAIVFYDWSGKRRHELSLGTRVKNTLVSHNEPLEIAIHPNGGRAVARLVDRLVFVDYASLPAPPVEPPDLPEPLPGPTRVPGKVSAGEPVLSEGVRTTRIEVPDAGGVEPCWDGTGEHFYHVGAAGTVHRVRVKDFADVTQRAIGHRVQQLGWTAAGLAALTTAQVLLLDPETLAVKATVRLPSASRLRLACAVGSVRVVAVAANSANEVYLVDLKEGKVVSRSIEGRPARASTLSHPALTPDGKTLFLSGGGQHHRVRVEAGRLVLDASRRAAASMAHAYAITPDGKRVVCFALTSTFGKAGKIEATEVFSTTSWDTPPLSFPTHYREAAFDAAGNLLVQPQVNGRRGGVQLLLAPLAAEPRLRDLHWHYGTVNWFHPRPRGGAALVSTTSSGGQPHRLYYLEWAPVP